MKDWLKIHSVGQIQMHKRFESILFIRTKHNMQMFRVVPFINNNNNNRELIEHFWKLKALYKLKKNIQCADTHNYTNQLYTKHTKINKHFHQATKQQLNS